MDSSTTKLTYHDRSARILSLSITIWPLKSTSRCFCMDKKRTLIYITISPTNYPSLNPTNYPTESVSNIPTSEPSIHPTLSIVYMHFYIIPYEYNLYSLDISTMIGFNIISTSKNDNIIYFVYQNRQLLSSGNKSELYERNMILLPTQNI
eukprot:128017_1